MGRAQDPDHATARRALLDAIAREVRAHGTGDGARELDPRVVAALATVPRERFVPPGEEIAAYDNRPLPIGHGQTISQPLIVALMTHLLWVAPGARVLEIGTGSGYQTAILAELAREVVTVEIVPSLAARAKATLHQLGYHNVRYVVGDGAEGCPEHAPYDGILVTAAPRGVPDGLLHQLGPGGRMIIPLGPTPQLQELFVVEKDQTGAIARRALFPVAFVPLTRSGSADSERDDRPT